jgi:hypothetical protein
MRVNLSWQLRLRTIRTRLLEAFRDTLTNHLLLGMATTTRSQGLYTENVT